MSITNKIASSTESINITTIGATMRPHINMNNIISIAIVLINDIMPNADVAIFIINNIIITS